MVQPFQVDQASVPDLSWLFQVAAMQEQQQQVQQAQAEAAAARSKADDAGRAATQAQHQLHQLHDAFRSGCAVHLCQRPNRIVCRLPFEVALAQLACTDFCLYPLSSDSMVVSLLSIGIKLEHIKCMQRGAWQAR